MSDDPHVYPGTDVLRNLRGIRDGGELEEFEARLTLVRSPPLIVAYPRRRRLSRPPTNPLLTGIF